MAAADEVADTARGMTLLIAFGAYLAVLALFLLWWARLPQ
jgi:hypothetical protein